MCIYPSYQHSDPTTLRPVPASLWEEVEGVGFQLGAEGESRAEGGPGSAEHIPRREREESSFYDDPRRLCQDCQLECPAALIAMRTSAH